MCDYLKLMALMFYLAYIPVGLSGCLGLSFVYRCVVSLFVSCFVCVLVFLVLIWTYTYHNILPALLTCPLIPVIKLLFEFFSSIIRGFYSFGVDLDVLFFSSVGLDK